MEAFLGPNLPSEATSKASVIKYANEEGPRSINPPPLKFSIWGSSVRGKQGEPHRPMLPLTGSADDGKRSSLNVTFVRGFPRGKTQLTPSGYPKPVGSAGWVPRAGSRFLHDVIERTPLFGVFFV